MLGIESSSYKRNKPNEFIFVITTAHRCEESCTDRSNPSACEEDWPLDVREEMVVAEQVPEFACVMLTSSETSAPWGGNGKGGSGSRSQKRFGSRQLVRRLLRMDNGILSSSTCTMPDDSNALHQIKPDKKHIHTWSALDTRVSFRTLVGLSPTVSIASRVFNTSRAVSPRAPSTVP